MCYINIHNLKTSVYVCFFCVMCLLLNGVLLFIILTHLHHLLALSWYAIIITIVRILIDVRFVIMQCLITMIGVILLQMVLNLTQSFQIRKFNGNVFQVRLDNFLVNCIDNIILNYIMISGYTRKEILSIANVVIWKHLFQAAIRVNKYTHFKNCAKTFW